MIYESAKVVGGPSCGAKTDSLSLARLVPALASVQKLKGSGFSS